MRRRLLLAQTLVLLAGGVTTWVVASVAGPPLFRGAPSPGRRRA